LYDIINAQVIGLRELHYPQPINTRIEAGIVDVFFQVLLDIFHRIEKINENGKQLMRLDTIELSKIIETLGIPTSSSYRSHLDAYLSMWFFRDPRDLEKNIMASQVDLF
jgi:hypothetical protein